MPNHSTVAIILRGQAFRSGGRGSVGCDKSSERGQLKLAQSLLDKIVLPLEGESNRVHLYAYEGSACAAGLQHITRLFGGRTADAKAFESTDQAYGMKHALDLFNSRVVYPSKYDVVIVARFDIFWKLPIDAWPTVDFGAFNFFSHCEKATTWCHGQSCSIPKFCVNDVVFAMPGTYFQQFRKRVVGAQRCFETGRSWGSGHEGCYTRASEAFGENHIAFITDWIPEKDVREINSVLNLGGTS